jgi:hypothetical protein
VTWENYGVAVRESVVDQGGNGRTVVRVMVDRESLGAVDDEFAPHAMGFPLDAAGTFDDLLDLIEDRSYLPTVSGMSSWSVHVGTADRFDRLVAICSDFWPFRTYPSGGVVRPVDLVGADGVCRLHFVFHEGVRPEDLAARLRRLAEQ